MSICVMFDKFFSAHWGFSENEMQFAYNQDPEQWVEPPVFLAITPELNTRLFKFYQVMTTWSKSDLSSYVAELADKSELAESYESKPGSVFLLFDKMCHIHWSFSGELTKKSYTDNPDLWVSVPVELKLTDALNSKLNEFYNSVPQTKE